MTKALGGALMENIVTEKRCSMCGEVKPVTEFYKKRKSWNSRCISCAKQYTHKHYIKNKEKLDKQHTAYNKAHPEKARARTKKWTLANKEKVAKKTRLYRIANAEKVAETLKKFHQYRPEYRKKYYNAHKDNYIVYKNKRRAVEKDATATLTAQEWKEIKDKYGNHCIYPGCNSTKVTLDHVIPLSKGGTHTADNVQPLCLKHNLKKFTKAIDYR